MYVVIRKFSNVRSVEETGRRVAEGIGPILKQTPGFRGFYAFDGGNGVGCTVGLYDSREAAEAVNEAAINAWLKENLPEVYDGPPPEVTRGKVVGSVTA